MNVRPHLSPRLKQQLMLSLVLFLPPSPSLFFSLPFFLSLCPSFCLSLLKSQGGHRQLLMGHGCIAVMQSLPLSVCAVPQPESEQGHNPFRQPPPKSEGMKHMLPQINHCDQSHGCTTNQWSERL